MTVRQGLRGNVIELEGEILRETDKAIEFRYKHHKTNSQRTQWFPISQLEEIHRTEPAVIVASQWIMNKKDEEWLTTH